ncbi:MAG TPA: SRPBCC family protein [Baekduia sp.]|nr:SRPBCC family protein [Baekduia sp.]
MSEVVTSIEIAAPVEEVFDLVMDAERLHEWVTIHRELLSHSDSHMQQKLCLRGATFKVDWELAQASRPTHVHWKGRGPARSKAETEYRLSPTPDGGTRFDYRNEFKAPLGPLGAVASHALVGGLPEREAHASLQKLKQLLEK